jgi:ribosomal-protein-alanine N-acetyltransferase
MAEPLPFLVEPMVRSDLPEVMAIERQSFSAPWSERAYRYELEQNHRGAMLIVRQTAAGLNEVLRRLNVLAHGGAPVLGYGGLWLLADEAHISTLAVHPRWRGHGLGELLLLALIDRGAAMGARLASLEVRVSNHVAQGLYEKYWFDVTGRQPRYYSDNNEDAYLMATPLFSTPEFQVVLERNRAALDARLRAGASRPPRAAHAGQKGPDPLQ